MKLLLTSKGITNKSIANALQDLLSKPIDETRIAFIPTAMNVSRGDKSWFIENLVELKQMNFGFFDIVDISALPKDIWFPRLEKADVLIFSGGTSPHLMYWLKQSGLAPLLSELLKTRVYVGISAGSVITGPSLALANEEKRLEYRKVTGYGNSDALDLVNFYVSPHLNSPKHPDRNAKFLSEISKNVKEQIYALDDQSALKVVDGEVEVVGEGQHLLFNKL